MLKNDFDKIDGGPPRETQHTAKPPRGLRGLRARDAGVVRDEPAPPSWLEVAASLPNAPKPNAPLFDTAKEPDGPQTGRVSFTAEGLQTNLKKLRRAVASGEIKCIVITDPLDPSFSAEFVLADEEQREIRAKNYKGSHIQLGYDGIRRWFSSHQHEKSAPLILNDRIIGTVSLTGLDSRPELLTTDRIQPTSIYNVSELQDPRRHLRHNQYYASDLSSHFDYPRALSQLTQSDQSAEIYAPSFRGNSLSGRLWRPDAPIRIDHSSGMKFIRTDRAFYERADRPVLVATFNESGTLASVVGIITPAQFETDPNKPVNYGPHQQPRDINILYMSRLANDVRGSFRRELSGLQEGQSRGLLFNMHLVAQIYPEASQMDAAASMPYSKLFSEGSHLPGFLQQSFEAAKGPIRIHEPKNVSRTVAYLTKPDPYKS